MTTIPHSLKYRPDIDGLRGISILLVVLFHAAPNLFPGGFIGVDIFFVISGYLITLILLRENNQNSFSFLSFYCRRVKRIFPSLLVMLGCSLLLGWLFLFPTEYVALSKQMLSGVFFLSNFLFWRETGYFNNESESKALLNLWSLSIEEQFYILFPALVWICFKTNPRRLFSLLVLFFCVSIGLSILGSETRPVATFYLPITRGWELLVGCLLANYEFNRSGNKISNFSPSQIKKAGFLLGGSALGIILFFTFWLNPSKPFPGYLALFPTFSAAAIIFAGIHSPVNKFLLSNKIIIFLGLISYPLYLWHWPVLYFAKILFQDTALHTSVLLAIIVSFLLSLATYFFVELPIRKNKENTLRVVKMQVCFSLGVVLLSSLSVIGILPSRLALNPLVMEADVAKSDWEYPFQNNFKKNNDFVIVNASHEKSKGGGVLFVGDSKMEQYWPRIKYVRDHFEGLVRPIYFLTAGGSPTLPNVRNRAPGYHDDIFYKFCIDSASSSDIEIVVFCCFWEGYFPNENAEHTSLGLYYINDPLKDRLELDSEYFLKVIEQFGNDIRKLVDSGKVVYVILSGASSQSWNPKNISRFQFITKSSDRLPVSIDEINKLTISIDNFVSKVTLANGGKIIDPKKFLLDDGGFYGRSKDGKFNYKDSHHMRPHYAREKAVYMDYIMIK
jgi:peptidoglycan/LPS O-acetylase OafA/YrhL